MYWAVLDTAAGRNYISRTLSRDLKREPVEWVTKSLVTIHSEASPKRLPWYDFEIQNIEGEKFETDALAVSRENLGSLYRTPMKTLKENYPHLQGKPVYSSNNNIYEIHMIMGIVMFDNICSDVIIKGEEGEPVIEKTKF